jgi:hypothetical protein
MKTSQQWSNQDGRDSVLQLVALVLTVMVVGLVLGEWAQSAPAEGGRPQDPAPERVVAAPTPEATALPAAPEAPTARSARPLPAPVAFARAPRAAPELVARVAEEARAKIEEQRDYIASSCGNGGADGRPAAKLTFNITFDAQGREIARGISEDRRAPAGEFGRCLRKLQGITLAVAPPGSNVGVSIPVAFP